MKLDFNKLSNIQKDFRLGNLGEGFNAWNIKQILDEDDNLTLSSVITAVEKRKICKSKIGENKLDELTEDERQILKMCDEKLHIETQFYEVSIDGGNITLFILEHENKLVKVFSFNDHEHSDGEIYEEEVKKIIKRTTIVYDFEEGYKTRID